MKLREKKKKKPKDSDYIKFRLEEILVWRRGGLGSNFKDIIQFYNDYYDLIDLYLEKKKNLQYSMEFIKKRIQLANILNEGYDHFTNRSFEKSLTLFKRSLEMLKPFGVTNETLIEHMEDIAGFAPIEITNYIKKYYSPFVLSIDRRSWRPLSKEVEEISKKIKDFLNEKISQIELFIQYQTYIEDFNSRLRQRQYNSAFNYFLKAESKRSQLINKDLFLDEKIEERLNLNLKVVVSNLSLKIKKTVLNLGTKYTRLEIREIAEKCAIDNEDLITKIVKDMINNKEIYAEYFSSSNSISFDQQANINEIDKLMKKYDEWEKKSLSKKH